MIILQAKIAEVSDIKSRNVVVSKLPDVDESNPLILLTLSR